MHIAQGPCVIIVLYFSSKGTQHEGENKNQVLLVAERERKIQQAGKFYFCL